MLSIIALPLQPTNTFAAYDQVVAEIMWSKQYSSQSFLPTVNEYVMYDVTLKNIGDLVLEGQSLAVTFVSEGRKTDLHTSYSIGMLLPGESTVLHLGPFKMRESGEHSLFLGMRNADASEAVIIANLDGSKAVDSFMVYGSEVPFMLVIGTVSIVSGFGIVAWYFSIGKKKRIEQKGEVDSMGRQSL